MFTFGLVLCSFTAHTAHAQTDWPSKPIVIIVPYAPGGFSDTRFRLLAKKLSEKFGQPVILDNKAGAGGVLGTAMVAKAAKDGYTLGVGSFASQAINPALMKKIPYDVATDLAPVSHLHNEILKDPDVVKAISDVGSQAVGGSAEAFGKFILTEQEKWARVIKTGNIPKE